ncbi:3-oxoacyl-[acyl-carrier protein] reductase [Flavobacteriaceae bacterium MAR_2010_188]|nr:3-oxoacyl-[acyl-carrier protein] reductase [Flavobacteriaceae bacterium MAR_2010_188]
MNSPLKYALVTGGSRGIGRAICLQLAKDTNYHILINYNSNEEEALKTLELIEEADGFGELIKFDVANQNSVANALNHWHSENSNGIIEVIVNNAGIKNDNLMVFMKSEDWKNVIDTNLNGFFNVVSNLLKPMILNKYGRIINVVSLSGLKGQAGQTNYSAAKGGIIAATKSLAQEVAKKHITVNAVAPGFIKTDMTNDLDENDLKKLIPVNRFGNPEEVAHLVSFLASKKASYITGEVININGGIYS